MKKLVIMAVAAVVMIASCSSFKSYTVPEFKDYSETIAISGMDAAAIHMKTKFWVQEKYPNQSPTFSEREIKNIIVFTYSYRNTYLSFLIENERCQLTFYTDNKDKKFGGYEATKDVAYKRAFELMDKQKNLAVEYREYITISQEEIDALVAQGDEAYDKNQFGQAANFYSKARMAAPTDIYILNAYGLSLEGGALFTERFVIDTNKIMSVLTEWTASDKISGDRWAPSGSRVWHYHSDGGYDYECSRLESVYRADIGYLDRALEMFNTVLSIDPNNETALSLVEYVTQKKAYINNRRSQIQTALDNIKQSYAPTRNQLAEQQHQAELAQSLENLTQSMNRLSQSLARNQQNQSGYSGGGYSGGGQGQDASSDGSSASRDKNNFDIGRARNSYDRDAKNAESAWKNIKSSGDYSAQQRQTFQQCQTRMRKTREEASRNGHTISKSKWEDERLP